MSVPLNIDWQQILLHLFNFIILATGLYLLLYNPVKNFMERRKKYYEELEKQAGDKLAHAESMEKEYTQRLTDADLELRQRKAEESAKLAQESQQIIQQAKEQAEKIIADAENQAQAKKAQIVNSAQQDIADMVIAATEKLIAINQSTETDSALYEQFLTVAGKGTDF